MAEIVRRRSWGGVWPLGRHVSISGSSLIQCASASMAPPHPGWAKCYPGAEVQGRTGPSEGQGFQELGPGGEHTIGAQGLQVVEEAGSGSKRLAGVPPSA